MKTIKKFLLIFVFCTILFVGTTIKNTFSASFPLVRTEAAEILSNTAALINGSVNPNGALTTVWFEYGDSPDLKNYESVNPMIFGSADYFSPISHRLISLNQEKTYYYRVVAKNYAGVIRGSILSFSTKPIGQNVSIPDPVVEKATPLETVQPKVEEKTPPSTTESKGTTKGWLIVGGVAILIILFGFLFAKYMTKRKTIHKNRLLG